MNRLASVVVVAFACSAPPPEPRVAGEATPPSLTEQDVELDAEQTTLASGAETRRPEENYVSDKVRIDALGSLVGLDAVTRRALSPGDFEPLPKPKPGQWLHEHREAGQSFPQFARGQHLKPNETRDTLYIQPLGRLTASGAPAARTLVSFSRTYFGVKTKLLPAIDPRRLKLTWRQRQGGVQLHAGSVLNRLKERLPADGFLLLAVTGHDLYPEDSWNFVFGMATFRERVGVYSTARYNPSFLRAKVAVPGFATIVLRRTLNIMAHEIGHMYGVEHCVHFRCAMNGSNSLEETDASPIHLCPVCLRKLRHGAGFDIERRYRALRNFYRKHHLDEEAGFLDQRIQRLSSPAAKIKAPNPID